MRKVFCGIRRRDESALNCPSRLSLSRSIAMILTMDEKAKVILAEAPQWMQLDPSGNPYPLPVDAPKWLEWQRMSYLVSSAHKVGCQSFLPPLCSFPAVFLTMNPFMACPGHYPPSTVPWEGVQRPTLQALTRHVCPQRPSDPSFPERLPS